LIDLIIIFEKDESDVFCVPMLKPSIQRSTRKEAPTQQKAAPAPPSLPYNKPEWSSRPPLVENETESQLDTDGYCEHYYLEVIKSGTIVDKIKLQKEFVTVGRLDTCDIQPEHPSLSRYHAILQYSNGADDSSMKEGFYLYDLSSTHGTFLNKNKIEPNKFVHVGLENCVKFGLSTRLYILHGPKPKYNSDDLNFNLTHEQMKKIKEKHDRIAMKLRVQKELEEEERNEADGEVNWGMNDMKNHEDESVDRDASEIKLGKEEAIEESDESFYINDPSKALRNFFEREGEELEYDVEDKGYGKFVCRIRLPIDNDYGEAIYAQVEHEGKKKECMALCALEACRLLNAQGVLRQSREEIAKKKKRKDWESADYYDSDEDTFYDRTGEIEKKRIQRMANAGKFDDKTAKAIPGLNKNKVQTFETILNDIKLYMREENELSTKLDKCKEVSKAIADDDIDAYIRSLKVGTIDTVTRAKMKRRVVEINTELTRLEKLLNIAKPLGFDYAKWKNEFRKNFANQETVPTSVIKQKDLVTSAQVKDTEMGILREDGSNIQNELKLKPRVETKTVPDVDAASGESETKAKKIKTEHVSKLDEEQIKQEPKEKIQKPVSNLKPKSSIYPKTSSEEETSISDYETLYKTNSKEYAIWMPPEGQTGDGKTRLNDKFGY
jgi:pSer/pThr/pTyr-binding forkhead associated (FHA) protein